MKRIHLARWEVMAEAFVNILAFQQIPWIFTWEHLQNHLVLPADTLLEKRKS